MTKNRKRPEGDKTRPGEKDAGHPPQRRIEPSGFTFEGDEADDALSLEQVDHSGIELPEDTEHEATLLRVAQGVGAWLKERGAATAQEVTDATGELRHLVRGALEDLRQSGLAIWDYAPGDSVPVNPNEIRYRLTGPRQDVQGLTTVAESRYPSGVEMEKGEHDSRKSGSSDNLSLAGAQIHADLPSVRLLEDALSASADSRWMTLTGSEDPSLEDVQAWLDQVNAQVATQPDKHLGSFEANRLFARQLRELLREKGYLLREPESGRPAKLYHQAGGGSPAGQFVFKWMENGKQRAVGHSCSLPRLLAASAD